MTSSTSISASSPAHAAGAVGVAVTNTDGQSGALPNAYTYTSSNPAPTISSISPTSGTTAGGTAVTISGTGFLSGAAVSFGGTAATGVTVVSSTSIKASTPPHTAGAVNVVVTNADAQTGTLTNGYNYTSSTGGGNDHLCAGEIGDAAERHFFRRSRLHLGTSCWESEHRGCGMERHNFDGEFGDGQPGKYLHPCDRTDDGHRLTPVHLLRQEHRCGQQYCDCQIQPGGGLCGRASAGVQRSGYLDSTSTRQLERRAQATPSAAER